MRSIGVSDYEVAQLQELEAFAEGPSVLQIEINPWLGKTREAELAYCAEKGIYVEVPLC